jgi:hypothetical protein
MTADALPAHLEKGERASPVELPRQKEKPALPNEVTTIYVVRLFGVGLKKIKLTLEQEILAQYYRQPQVNTF